MSHGISTDPPSSIRPSDAMNRYMSPNSGLVIAPFSSPRAQNRDCLATSSHCHLVEARYQCSQPDRCRPRLSVRRVHFSVADGPHVRRDGPMLAHNRYARPKVKHARIARVEDRRFAPLLDVDQRFQLTLGGDVRHRWWRSSTRLGAWSGRQSTCSRIVGQTGMFCESAAHAFPCFHYP